MARPPRSSRRSAPADAPQRHLAALRDLLPEAFTDGQVDFGLLADLLGATPSASEERYGLSWHGRRRARHLASTPATCALCPAPEEGLDPPASGNLLIEGDSLEALKLLREDFAARVDLIYIDPPYNTGNDFVYPDDFRHSLAEYRRLTGETGSAGRRHTAWLNMMYPRLLLARELLSRRGAIAVSIDDHEVHNLRHLLDAVFGDANFVAELCVSLNPKGRQLSPFFATSHEYVIIYARDLAACALNAGSAEAVDHADFPLRDETGSHRLLPLRNTNRKFHPGTRPNLYYPLYVHPGTTAVSVSPAPGAVEVLPVFGDGSAAVWRWSSSLARERSRELQGRQVKGRRGDRWDVFQKDYLTPGRTKKLKTVWLSADVGSTDAAVGEVKRLLGPVFSNPKPLRLMRQLVRLMPADAVVLDFFAGSGSTGHAVMLENARGASRRYLLVQLPEPLEAGNPTDAAACELCDSLGRPHNLAEITRERLRRAAAEVRAEHPGYDGDLGFRVLKLC